MVMISEPVTTTIYWKKETPMKQQYVIFDLSDEHYGVDIAAVESIIKIQPITSMPQSPSFVEGITNLRGEVLPVIDLRKRFELASKDISKETRIVVVNINGTTVGMIVDAVSEVLTISDDVIEPPPPMVTTVDTAFITSIAKLEDKLVILLDLAKVLTVDETTDLQAMQV